MNIEHKIFINQYGQELISIDVLNDIFGKMDIIGKKAFLKDIIYVFIQQSKAGDDDIQDAISMSSLKPTYTPCIMIKKGLNTHNLEKIAELPENELGKVFILFLSIFKKAYQRRFELEKNNPDKWWYWDMSNNKNIEKIKKLFNCNNL